MIRFMVCLVLLAGPVGMPAAAQSFTAEQVLEKARSAYGTLKAIHLVVERQETSYVEGRAMSSVSECELAGKPGNRYYARFKTPDIDAMVVSDGSNMWRVLASRKQWTKVSAAALEDSGEEEAGNKTTPKDLHSVMEDALLYHSLSLIKSAQDPALVKEEDFKIGHTKLRGYLVRAHNKDAAFELLVDQQSFLVVRAKEQRKSPEGALEFITKVKQFEINQAVEDSLFSFEPKRGWSEVEMLVLPGEQRMVLTGERAANFSLKTLSGEAVALASLQGKVVVLDFWATWCGPCRAELPSIEKLRTEFGDTVQFYGINDEETSTVKKYVNEKKLQMPVLLDSKQDVHRRYGVRAIPTLLIIGPDGVIRQHFIGSRAESVLRKAIQSALDGKA